MVAKINILKRLLDALNYNEQKVQKGKAECIGAGNYLGKVCEMNFYEKLERLKSLDELNTRATTKTIHISLNFDPSEKYSDEKLSDIASAYMEGIGFSEQPYLVYKHEDAGHPHIHIVSTAIRPDGKRINTHNIGKNQSEKTRKQIEQMFGLVKAGSKLVVQDRSIKPITPERISYGKNETKRSINNVVSTVFNEYTFTSLPEFNAALKQFGVVADRGTEESRIYKNRGIVYRITDQSGRTLGVPVKASLLSCKPTLNNLEKRFLENQEKKEQFRNVIKSSIDDCLSKNPGSLPELINLLKMANVYSLIRQSSDGRYFGVTFVDNRTRCVFNGSDIGKLYSVAGLQQRILKASEKPVVATSVAAPQTLKERTVDQNYKKTTLLEELINPKQEQESIPFELKKKKKKRKNNN